MITKDTAFSNNDTPEPVHILVLETDEPHPETQTRKGSFGDILHDLFTKAGNNHPPPLSVKTSMHYIVDDPKNNNHGSVPSITSIPSTTKAILVTGSVYDAHGSDPWILSLLSLLHELWQTRPDMQFAGICFGHQILARLLGASVNAHPSGDWEIAHTKMTLTPIGQKLFKTSDSELFLHQMHQDQVTSIPSNSDLLAGRKVHVWAKTDHTEVQGLYVRDRLFTTQGHIGFDEKMVHRQIEMREESIGETVAEQAKETAHMEHDGLVVAEAVLRFFHGNDHDID